MVERQKICKKLARGSGHGKPLFGFAINHPLNRRELHNDRMHSKLNPEFKAEHEVAGGAVLDFV